MAATAKAASRFNCNAAVSRIIGVLPDMSFKTWTGWLARAIAGLRSLAPYAAIEILLPGGSLMALLLWLYRRQKSRQARQGQRGVAVALCSEAMVLQGGHH
jgi:hypothetical protein